MNIFGKLYCIKKVDLQQIIMITPKISGIKGPYSNLMTLSGLPMNKMTVDTLHSHIIVTMIFYNTFYYYILFLFFF